MIERLSWGGVALPWVDLFIIRMFSTHRTVRHVILSGHFTRVSCLLVEWVLTTIRIWIVLKISSIRWL